MKILSAAQIRQTDEFTIRNEPIASIDLMERAAGRFTDLFTEIFPTPSFVSIYCGLGNNGGDGLAIARKLHHAGYDVKVFVVRYSHVSSPDFNTNLERLQNIGLAIEEINSSDDFQPIDSETLVIDALWGTGMSRPVSGLGKEIIDLINKSGAQIIAVDVPSGLIADTPTSGITVQADITITFQRPKLSFLFPDNYHAVGEWVLIDIGLDEQYISTLPSIHHLITQELIGNIWQPRSKFSHKGDFGHALLISGSKGKAGAAILASKAALRAGAGLVTVQVPGCAYTILQTAVPEAMVISDKNIDMISDFYTGDQFRCIGIGPGLGQSEETAKAFERFLSNNNLPLVIDADGLNLLAKHPSWLSKLPKESVLTPHPGEFERLVGRASDSFDKLQKQIEFSAKHRVHVILKGAHTTITTPDGQVYFNTTGNPGMATAGSGDVLTGLLTGLISSGYSSIEASILGVFIHGHAADIAIEEGSEEALIASDIIEGLKKAFGEIANGFA